MDLDGKSGVLRWLVSMSEYELMLIEGTVGPWRRYALDIFVAMDSVLKEEFN